MQTLRSTDRQVLGETRQVLNAFLGGSINHSDDRESDYCEGQRKQPEQDGREHTSRFESERFHIDI
jgi:hypothetical protein